MDKVVTKATAISVAAKYGLELEVEECIDGGMPPVDALAYWDLI